MFKKTARILALTIAASCLTSCARQNAATRIDVSDWEAARALGYECEKSEDRGEKLRLAQEGIAVSNRCAAKTPKEAGCYYYRAVLTGLYYKSKVVGYQKGLKSMKTDLEHVLRLDSDFDHGGAYRILGQIYTEVPAISLKKRAITKDIDKALEYLNKAIAIAPDYPENHLALSKAYLEAGEKDQAAMALSEGRSHLSQWQSHIDYPYWKEESQKLAKRLKKRMKDLQSEE